MMRNMAKPLFKRSIFTRRAAPPLDYMPWPNEHSLVCTTPEVVGDCVSRDCVVLAVAEVRAILIDLDLNCSPNLPFQIQGSPALLLWSAANPDISMISGAEDTSSHYKLMSNASFEHCRPRYQWASRQEGLFRAPKKPPFKHLA